jgi:hypothetical protein
VPPPAPKAAPLPTGLGASGRCTRLRSWQIAAAAPPRRLRGVVGVLPAAAEADACSPPPMQPAAGRRVPAADAARSVMQPLQLLGVQQLGDGHLVHAAGKGRGTAGRTAVRPNATQWLPLQRPERCNRARAGMLNGMCLSTATASSAAQSTHRFACGLALKFVASGESSLSLRVGETGDLGGARGMSVAMTSVGGSREAVLSLSGGASRPERCGGRRPMSSMLCGDVSPIVRRPRLG